MARIFRGLSSTLLDCGCLLGIYETYDAIVIGVLDAKGRSCTVPSHEPGNEIPVPPAGDGREPVDPSDSADA